MIRDIWEWCMDYLPLIMAVVIFGAATYFCIYFVNVNYNYEKKRNQNRIQKYDEFKTGAYVYIRGLNFTGIVDHADLYYATIIGKSTNGQIYKIENIRTELLRFTPKLED